MNSTSRRDPYSGWNSAVEIDFLRDLMNLDLWNIRLTARDRTTGKVGLPQGYDDGNSTHCKHSYLRSLRF